MVRITKQQMAEYERLKKLCSSYLKAQAKYRESHKEYFREYHKKWQKDNKEKISQYQKARRAQKKLFDNKANSDIVNADGEQK